VQFLEWLTLEVYPEQALIILMDTASFHPAAAVKAFCALVQHRLQVIYLPPYCSNLNRMERYWKHLKRLAGANRLFESLDQLAAQLRCWLELQNQPAAPEHFAFVL
jgi:transposase